MFSYIKSLLMMLCLNLGLYTGHSLREGGVTMSAIAGLANWEIKSLGQWRSNTYQSFIKETPEMWASSTKWMAMAQLPALSTISDPTQ